MRSICVIPARMASSRLPGKPLKPLLGMPLIQHIYFRCRLFADFERVIVATCDAAIADSIRSVGGEAVMTADTHERCTDRVQEAVDGMKLDLDDRDLVLMVQGDEILVSPDMLAATAARYAQTGAAVVNLVSRLYAAEDQDDVNAVKAVMAPDDRILYFSRSGIPSRARAGKDHKVYQQTGVIAFRPSLLSTFSSLPQTPLERIESCDMLRLLEHHMPIYAVRTEVETIGVDTAADHARAETALAADPLTARYLRP
jgi:3-deoxy-manno-octulosonate cytidylyltransferase (CMP-KDO synthetase)